MPLVAKELKAGGDALEEAETLKPEPVIIPEKEKDGLVAATVMAMARAAADLGAATVTAIARAAADLDAAMVTAMDRVAADSDVVMVRGAAKAAARGDLAGTMMMVMAPEMAHAAVDSDVAMQGRAMVAVGHKAADKLADDAVAVDSVTDR